MMVNRKAEPAIEAPKRQSVVLFPWGVFKVIFGVAVALTLISGFGYALRTTVLAPETFGWSVTNYFDVDLEYNFPAYFSSLILFLSALVLLYIALTTKAHGEQGYPYWLGLAGIFLFIATDEMLHIHERFIEVVRTMLGTGGFLYYAWVIPYGLMAIVIGLLYLPFLLRLPPRIRNLFLLSAAIFVGGGIGMEMVGGFLVSVDTGASAQMNDLLVVLATHIEELLEMTGVSLFLYALLTYIQQRYGQVSIDLSAGRLADAFAGQKEST